MMMMMITNLNMMMSCSAKVFIVEFKEISLNKLQMAPQSEANPNMRCTTSRRATVRGIFHGQPHGSLVVN